MTATRRRRMCLFSELITARTRKREAGVAFSNRAPVVDEREPPANALPGTEAKILLMQDRAAKGFAIFHKDDPKFEGLPDAEIVGVLQPLHTGPRRRGGNGGDDGDEENGDMA